ncbi:hypothetical protein BaRGS_00036420 [Batillaria attramentaria]|uniref:Uncharacterized protein n=1 Tax=Batillaria attramentaria TaxID=370345 RepID=A0ABD0JBF0_9CAEN
MVFHFVILRCIVESFHYVCIVGTTSCSHVTFSCSDVFVNLFGTLGMVTGPAIQTKFLKSLAFMLEAASTYWQSRFWVQTQTIASLRVSEVRVVVVYAESSSRQGNVMCSYEGDPFC